MEYLSLYRKWRPQSFADGFIGQEHVVRTLRNALIQGKVGHAYLFTGPRGTGKTTAAKVFSKAINCTGRLKESPDPCNACPSCERISAGVSLDVLEIDGASNRGIDEIRDLREKVKFAPAEGEYKIYIIDEVHMLTMEAFNALLKTLEEPPTHVIFIFATTEVHKVPATILSRCQRFDFKRLSTEEICGRLESILKEEGRNYESDALRAIARRADGGMRDGISLLEQTLAHAEDKVTLRDVRSVLGLVEDERLLQLAQAVLQRNAGTCLNILESLWIDGKDPYLLTRETAFFFRDLLLLALPGEAAELVELEGDLREQASELARSASTSRLRHAAEVLTEAAQNVRRGAEGTLPIEMALVRLAVEEESETLAKIKALEERILRLESRPATFTTETVTATNKVPLPNNLEKPLTESVQSQPPATKAKDDGSSNSQLAVGDAQTRWEEILQVVREKKRTVEALLREGDPGTLQGNRWTIYFKSQFKFHLDNLNQPAVRALVNEAATKVLGFPVSLECVPQEEEKRVKSRSQDNLASENAQDFLQRSMAILGGEAVKLKEE
jgi:DNA polymerase-3 subunit gamma/tau